MWSYEKRLQYPVNIKKPDAKAAKAIISQYGGPDGELGASMRYLSQRFSMTDRRVAGVLTDIGVSVTKLQITKIQETGTSPWICENFTRNIKVLFL